MAFNMKYRKGTLILEIKDYFIKNCTYKFDTRVLNIIIKHKIRKIIIDTKELKMIDKYSLNILKSIVNAVKKNNGIIHYSNYSKIIRLTEG